MKTDVLIKILGDLRNLKNVDESELIDMTKEYPYVQNFRFLLAKKKQLTNNTDDLQAFQKLSGFISDKNHLYNRFAHSECENNVDIYQSPEIDRIIEEQLFPTISNDDITLENQGIDQLKVDPSKKASEAMDEIDKEIDKLPKVDIEEIKTAKDTEPADSQIGELTSDELISEESSRETSKKEEFSDETPRNISDPEDTFEENEIQVITFESSFDSSASDEQQIESEQNADEQIDKNRGEEKRIEEILDEENSLEENQNLDLASVDKKEDDLDFIRVKPLKQKLKRNKKKKNKIKSKKQSKKDSKKSEAKVMPLGKQSASPKKKKTEKVKKEQVSQIEEKPMSQKEDLSSFSAWLSSLKTETTEIANDVSIDLDSQKKPKKNKGKKSKKEKKIKLKRKTSNKKKKDKNKKKHKLQHKIDASLERKPLVVSETLAKMMANQGHITEAIDIYNQLILLYPEKSSYFADQIKKLD